MLITILSAEYLDISAKCRCWGRLSELISSRWWYCSVGQQVQTGGRRSQLVTRKQFMRSTHSLLQMISWGGPGLILLQLYRQLLGRNVITRLGTIMNLALSVISKHSDQTSSGHWENHAIPHFISLMMNCHCSRASQWFQQISRDNLRHSAHLEIYLTVCLAGGELKFLIILFLKYFWNIHPIIYMLGCGNNTFIVQTNCQFYLFFKEFLWGVFTGFKNIFTFRILSSFWQK